MSNDNLNEDKININYEKLRIVNECLKEALDGINNMPQHAMQSYITHYDYAVVLMTIKSVIDSFLTEKKEKDK